MYPGANDVWRVGERTILQRQNDGLCRFVLRINRIATFAFIYVTKLIEAPTDYPSRKNNELRNADGIQEPSTPAPTDHSKVSVHSFEFIRIFLSRIFDYRFPNLFDIFPFPLATSHGSPLSLNLNKRNLIRFEWLTFVDYISTRSRSHENGQHLMRLVSLHTVHMFRN